MGAMRQIMQWSRGGVHVFVQNLSLLTTDFVQIFVKNDRFCTDCKHKTDFVQIDFLKWIGFCNDVFFKMQAYATNRICILVGCNVLAFTKVQACCNKHEKWRLPPVKPTV